MVQYRERFEVLTVVVIAEAEELPLLGAVTRQRLVKTQQTGKA
jgi:hypothetical protein